MEICQIRSWGYVRLVEGTCQRRISYVDLVATLGTASRLIVHK